MIDLDLFPRQAACTQRAASGLANFEVLWSLETDRHEAPNQRRGGWSGVSHHVPADGTAIVLTRALDGFSSLDEWNATHAHSDQRQRRSLIVAIAHACARLHHHRLEHSCLYGKHLSSGRGLRRPLGIRKAISAS